MPKIGKRGEKKYAHAEQQLQMKPADSDIESLM